MGEMMGKKAKQEELPGMEARDVPEIEQAAEIYRRIRSERCELSKRESEAKNALIQVMKNLGRSFYNYGGLRVQLKITDRVNVRATADDDDEPIGTFRSTNRREPEINTSPASDFIAEIDAEEEAQRAAGEAEEQTTERQRRHKEAVATWRREPGAPVEIKEEREEEGEANPQVNEHGVYVEGVEVIIVPFPKNAENTEVVISLVKDKVDGMWRSTYSATAGVASFTGPIYDHEPCHEMREGAIAAAGWKARSFLLKQISTGGLSEAAKRQVEAAIPALDDWLEINAVDHSAAYPDDEIEADPDDVRTPQVFVPKLQNAIEHALLHHVQNAAGRWKPLQKNGATDAELTARISDEFSGEGGSNANGGWKVKGGKSPQFAWNYDSSILKGKRLLAEVREVLQIGPPVQTDQADDFTAERCDECGRIDGAHTPECPKSNALRFEDYLAYAKARYKSNHQSHARKMDLTKMNDEQVREWKQQQAGNGKEPVKCNHPSGCESQTPATKPKCFGGGLGDVNKPV